MELTRRSFLKGIGAMSVTLLFKRQLESVLDSLEHELVSLPPTNPAQLPTAADIVINPQVAFRARRIVVSPQVARLFTIENIKVGETSQLLSEIPAEVFVPSSFGAEIMMDTASQSVPLCFRVRYVGDSKDGAKFLGAVFGQTLDPGPAVSAREPIRTMWRIPLESIQLGA